MDQTIRRNTQLLYATADQKHSEMQRLLAAGADPNFFDTNHRCTPLHVAVHRADVEAAEILVKSGANPNQSRDANGNTARMLAQKAPRIRELLQVLSSSGSSSSPVVQRRSKACSYVRRPGTGAKGQLYESWMMALVLFRLLRRGGAFYLGSNVDGVGSMDDLVVRWDGKRMVFVQAKHRDKKILLDAVVDGKVARGEFSVHTNFLNYLMIRSKFGREDSEEIFREMFCDVDISLVMFTPAMYEKKPGQSDAVPVEHGDLLRTTREGDVLMVDYTKELGDNLLMNVNLDMISKIRTIESRMDAEFEHELVKDFLGSYRIYCNQAKEDEIEAILEDELTSYDVHIRNERTPLLAIVFHCIVQDHWKETGTIEFQTEQCKFLEQARKRASEPLLAISTTIVHNRIHHYSLEYSKDAMRCLADLDGTKIVNITNSSSLLLSFVKAVQYFEQSCAESTVLVNFDQIGISHCDVIFSTFAEQRNLKCLIIVTRNQEKMQKVVKELQDFKSSNKTIVVVSENLFKCGVDLHHIDDSRISLADLTPSCQTDILSNHFIKFQGSKVKLLKLMGADLIPREVISGRMLLEFLHGNPCEIAPLLNEPIQYYIDREFRRFDRVLELKNTLELAIVESDEKVVADGRDLVIISDTRDRFERICDRFPARNVHWFRKHARFYTWQSSRNSLENVRKLLKYGEVHYPANTFESFHDRVVIIAAEPGMGKTTVLTKLTISTRDDDFVWIVRINLLNHTRQLKDLEHVKIDWDVTSNFLLQSVRSLAVPSDLQHLESEVFHRMYQLEKMIVLFDGYDEVAPIYTCQVIDLLKVLKVSKIRQLIVTTRDTSVRTHLENQLEVFAHTLVPFTEQNVRDFLRKYWQSSPNIHEFDESRFEVFTTELINRYTQSIVTGVERFIGIPLHIEMIARVVRRTFEDHQNSQSSDYKEKLHDQLNLLALYREFIRIKFEDIHLAEKNKIDPSKPICSDEGLWKRFLKRHKRLAVNAIFDEHELNVLLSKEQAWLLSEDLSKVQQGIEKKGFINRVVNQRAQFVHLTYAEYFVANFLWRFVKKRSVAKFQPILDDILVRNLIANDREQLCRFLHALTLEDSDMIVHHSEKGCLLLKSFNPQNTTSSYGCLLGIVEHCLRADSPAIVETIATFPESDMLSLLETSSKMGYIRLVQTLCQMLNKNLLKQELEGGIWRESPLYLAYANNQLEVIKVLVRTFHYDVTWLDRTSNCLFSTLLNDHDYAGINTLINAGLTELNHIYHAKHLPLAVALANSQTPQSTIELMLGVIEPEAVDNVPFRDIGSQLLKRDRSLTEAFLNKGIDLLQATEPLTWSCYGIEAVFEPVWIDRTQLLVEREVGFDQSATLSLIRRMHHILQALQVASCDGSGVADVILKAALTNNYPQAVRLSSDGRRLHFGDTLQINVLKLRPHADPDILKAFKLNDLPQTSKALHDLMTQIYNTGGMDLLFKVLIHFKSVTTSTTIPYDVLANKSSQLVTLMNDLNQQYRELLNAIEVRNYDSIRKPLRKSVINSQDETFGSPLHHAVFIGDLEATNVLLENGANPNNRLKHVNPNKLIFAEQLKDVMNFDNCTPLHVAAGRGDLSVVEALVAKGGNVRATTAYKHLKPLQVAERKGFVEVVNWLRDVEGLQVS